MREQCAAEARLDAALMYGSFTQGSGDEWSDVEFWLFFDKDALTNIDRDSWCEGISPALLTVENEFGTHVAIFESLVRGEFHFAATSAIEAIGQRGERPLTECWSLTALDSCV